MDPLANVALGHFVETPISKTIPSNVILIVSNVSQTLTTGALLVANTSSQAPLPSQTHAISSTKIVTSVTQSCTSGALLVASTISQPVPPAQSNPNVSVAKSKADTGHTVISSMGQIPRLSAPQNTINPVSKVVSQSGDVVQTGLPMCNPQIFVSTQSTPHMSLSGSTNPNLNIIASQGQSYQWLGQFKMGDTGAGSSYSPLQYGQQPGSYAGHQTYNYSMRYDHRMSKFFKKICMKLQV